MRCAENTIFGRVPRRSDHNGQFLGRLLGGAGGRRVGDTVAIGRATARVAVAHRSRPIRQHGVVPRLPIARPRGPALPAYLSGLVGSLRPHVREDLGSYQHRFTNDWDADIARQVQEDFDELILSPPLLEGKAQVNIKLGVSSGSRVRNNANQRARLDVEPWPCPE